MGGLVEQNARMARQFLGVTLRQWVEYLVAILLGNTIYYFSLVPNLPESLIHHGFDTDWGTLVDLGVCGGVYGLIRLAFSLYTHKPQN
jgi:hypothetical protein